MAYQDLAMPVDIPWKRLATSSDMMDKHHGDRKFPPKWRSSVTIFYHEPTELPETYCDRKITYLKIVCSITGYQVGAETGVDLPIGEEFNVLQTTLGEKYHACYGALLQVAVFPNTKKTIRVPLADYPYIMDFEPKRRELYEAVTRSGEILGRSADTVNVRKSSTSGETTEVSSKVGAEVKAGIPVIGGTISAEHSWGGGTHLEEQNVNTTDESREKRETYSSSTSLTQMYELFTGYHLGGNRALFYMVSRPHTTEEKDQYTFINGPRRLEGIQDVFLIINRPKDQPGICIETYLETAHLLDTEAERQPNGAPQPTEYSTYESEPFNMSELWSENKGPIGNTKDFEKVVFQLPPGCELDTSRPSPTQSFSIEKFGRLPAITINVPAGFYLVFTGDGSTFWRSLKGVSYKVVSGQVFLTITLRNGDNYFDPHFNVYVYTYYKCPRTNQQPSGQTSESHKERALFLTARGLDACIGVEANEVSKPSSVHQPVFWEKLFDPRYEEQLLDWLESNRVIELEAGTSKDYRQRLREMFKRKRSQFEKKLREAIDKGSADPIPDEWLRPSEWISFENKISVANLMSDPAVPAIQRIRAANDLTASIGQQMIESLGSNKRYPNRTVDFWHTSIALRELTKAVSILANDHPNNVPVKEIKIPYKAQFLKTFGPNLRLKELIALDVESLRRGLRLSEIQARQLKLNLMRSFGRTSEPSINNVSEPKYKSVKMRRVSKRNK